MTTYRVWTLRATNSDGTIGAFDTGTADVPTSDGAAQDVVALAHPSLTSSEVADRLEALADWVRCNPNLRVVDVGSAPGQPPPGGDAA